jgi:hypothetical protein
MASIYSLLWDSSGVIEESMMEERHKTSPGMLLSSERLITYVYPLLLGMTFACVTLLSDYQKSTYQ